MGRGGLNSQASTTPENGAARQWDQHVRHGFLRRGADVKSHVYSAGGDLAQEQLYRYTYPHSPSSPSKTGIDGLALHRQNTKDALMDAAQRLTAGESFKGLDAECELANRE